MSLGGHRRQALRAFQVLALAGLVLYALQAAVGDGASGVQDFFETYVYVALIGAGALLCLARSVATQHERAAWLTLGLGLGAWTAGEIYYSVVLSGLESPTLPSFADALWLAFYPAAYVAIVLLVRERVREFRRSVWIDGLVGALAVAALGAALVVGPITSSGADSRGVAVDLTYLGGDLLLIGFVVGIFAVTGWRPGRAFFLLGVGLALSAGADTFYLYQEATGAVGDSTLPAALWPAAVLLIGHAAWQPPLSRTIQMGGWRSLVAPLTFATLALGLLAADAFVHLHPAALILAVAALATLVVRLAVTFGENLRLIEATRREAMTDSLTGLGNRRLLMEDLSDAVAEASVEAPCALVMFDLDGFKQYNDRFGHPVGDSLLTRLGASLRLAVGDQGSGYRLGGDEFCLVATGPETDLRALTRRAHASLGEKGHGFEVGSSHGMVLIPMEAGSVAQALNLADERLYGEKGENRRMSVTLQTSDALVQVLKECQPELDGHVSDVARLARELGARMGLRGDRLDELTRAAKLHDIGKLAVPDDILEKDGPLSEAEWSFVRQHTLVGDRILSAAPALASVAALVRGSHECFDGSGYPDGLAGTEIPLGSRIVAVCDAFHAMTAGRPYRKPQTRAQALEELRNCAGGQFDPEAVEAFCALLAERDRPPALVALAT